MARLSRRLWGGTSLKTAVKEATDEWKELDKSKSFLQACGEDMFSEKIELCLQMFESLDLSEVNLEMFEKCIGRQIEASYRVFQSPTDLLRTLSNTGLCKLWNSSGGQEQAVAAKDPRLHGRKSQHQTSLSMRNNLKLTEGNFFGVTKGDHSL